jgi:hypothetical protein
MVAAVRVIEDQGDRPVGTGLGDQTGKPLDDVVPKSFCARSCVVRDTVTAHERGKPTKPAPADAADSISVCAILWAARTQSKRVGPGTERWHALEKATVRDQSDGEVIVVRHQFGRQPRFSQPAGAEHQGRSQLTERAPLPFCPQYCEFSNASGHEAPIGAHVG